MTAGAITAAANAPVPQAESGFDATTGTLTIGGTRYTAPKFTNARKKALDDFRKSQGMVEVADTLRTLGAKLKQLPSEDGEEKWAYDPEHPLTDREQKDLEDASARQVDYSFYALERLYVDAAGAPPVAKDAMEELHDDEAGAALRYAQANPTQRRTWSTSD
jgi:hypothetical protein